jgi:hypothetical protein
VSRRNQAGRREQAGSRRKRAVAAAATVTGTAAVLFAGYAAAGASGLIDVASLATLGVLIVARAGVRGREPRPVRQERQRRDPGRRPAIRAADFPAYASIASDLEWGRVSRRHYEHSLRPRLVRLAAALGREDTVAIARLTGPADADGPGVDLATLDRIITQLEGP